MSVIAILASEGSSEGSAADPGPGPQVQYHNRKNNLQIGMSLERCFSIHGRDRSDELNYEGDVGKREGCVIE